MKIDRAIEILDPEHRECYGNIEEVNQACRMGMEALKRQRWIPCSERLPKDWEKVLTYTHDGHYMSMQKFDAGGWLCDGWIIEDALVTHWMPLPEPPEEGGDEDAADRCG